MKVRPLDSCLKSHLCGLLAFSILVGILPFAGCTRNQTSLNKSGATIAANPNPVPPGEGFGTAIINWNTGNGTDGTVYVQTGNGQEQKFAGPAPRGSLDAPWIGVGTVYEFRLYAGNEPKDLLASVKVIRAEK
jgi:hypothetical protein